VRKRESQRRSSNFVKTCESAASTKKLKRALKAKMGINGKMLEIINEEGVYRKIQLIYNT